MIQPPTASPMLPLEIWVPKSLVAGQKEHGKEKKEGRRRSPFPKSFSKEIRRQVECYCRILSCYFFSEQRFEQNIFGNKVVSTCLYIVIHSNKASEWQVWYYHTNTASNERYSVFAIQGRLKIVNPYHIFLSTVHHYNLIYYKKNQTLVSLCLCC